MFFGSWPLNGVRRGLVSGVFRPFVPVLYGVLAVLGLNRIFEGGAWFVFQTQTTFTRLLLWNGETTRGLGLGCTKDVGQSLIRENQRY
ncbi:MAG: hypothetical protein QM234_08550, partial [Acidobacteriota bacterium]|nr:hypothetical protein [Acidobacteriota bacterium]